MNKVYLSIRPFLVNYYNYYKIPLNNTIDNILLISHNYIYVLHLLILHVLNSFGYDILYYKN